MSTPEAPAQAQASLSLDTPRDISIRLEPAGEGRFDVAIKTDAGPNPHNSNVAVLTRGGAFQVLKPSDWISTLRAPLTLPADQVQELMNSLWRNGVRPKDTKEGLLVILKAKAEKEVK